MTTQQIKMFLEAARQLNFTTAAERLFVTQPTLSRQIGALEEEMNARLFNRANNNVSLTPAGQELLEGLSHVDGYLDGLRFRVSSVTCGYTGVLRIGIGRDQVVYPWVKRAIFRFKERYPEVEISLNFMEPGPLYTDLYNCTLDVGVNTRASADIDVYAARLSTVVITRETECLALHERYADEVGDTVTLAQCAEIVKRHPLYMLSVSSFNNPQKNYENDTVFMLRQKPFATPQRLYTYLREDRRMTDFRFVTSLDTLLLSVECGLGTSFVNPSGALSRAKDVQLIPVEFEEGEPYDPIEPVLIYNDENSNETKENFLKIFRELQPEFS